MDFGQLTEDERDTLRMSFLATINDPTIPLLIKNKAEYLYSELKRTETEIAQAETQRRIKEEELLKRLKERS